MADFDVRAAVKVGDGVLLQKKMLLLRLTSV